MFWKSGGFKLLGDYLAHNSWHASGRLATQWEQVTLESDYYFMAVNMVSFDLVYFAKTTKDWCF
jgi:hypothetical protein